MSRPPAPQDAMSVRLIACARALVADPNNMDARRDYLRAAFNLDRTAATIAALADLAEARPDAA